MAAISLTLISRARDRIFRAVYPWALALAYVVAFAHAAALAWVVGGIIGIIFRGPA